MNNQLFLRKLSNLALKSEIERRIRSGEWEIDTHSSGTIYEGEVDMISTISWKEGLKDDGKFSHWEKIDLDELLEEQEKKVKQRKEKEKEVHHE